MPLLRRREARARQHLRQVPGQGADGVQALPAADAPERREGGAVGRGGPAPGPIRRRMRGGLFASQQTLDPASVERMAQEVGLNLRSSSRRTATARRPRTSVARDRKQGEDLDIQGTPSIFISGRLFLPVRTSSRDLDEWISLEIELTTGVTTPKGRALRLPPPAPPARLLRTAPLRRPPRRRLLRHRRALVPPQLRAFVRPLRAPHRARRPKLHRGGGAEGVGCFPTGRHYPGIAHLLRIVVAGLAEEFTGETALTAVRLVCIDTETTGRDPENDRVVEVAAVIWQGGDVVDRKAWLVNPASRSRKKPSTSTASGTSTSRTRPRSAR